MVERPIFTSEFAAIRQRYAERPDAKKANFLIYGPTGTGKTFSLRTAPKPVLVHCFDPGGTRCLKPWIDKGEILVEHFTDENYDNPSEFARWNARMGELHKRRIFEGVGTFSVDSLTTFYKLAFGFVMKKVGRLTSGPRIQDWGQVKSVMEKTINELCQLPCHVVITAHDSPVEENLADMPDRGIMVPGQLKKFIPAIMDEIYLAKTKNSSKGLEYLFQTERDSKWDARTRIGAGVLSQFETPDFAVILKKCGLPYEDKPL